jgi:nicotinate-nucleotide adenylyltransferase
MRRLGVFGGTFDPPHLGHLALAECAREQLRLDRVLFVPAGQPPHKRSGAPSSAGARLAMTRLAVRGNPGFAVSTLETARPGTSYTVDTLRALRAAHPDARLYLLLGADSLRDFRTWRAADAILELAVLAVARRPGVAAPRWSAAWRARRRLVWLTNAGLEVASRDVRARAASGRSIRYLVPDAVARWAARHRLYRAVP